MVKKTTKSHSKFTPINSSFQRWLLPGILTVTFYVISVLVAALYISQEAGLTAEANFIVVALFSLSLAAALWWLIETTRWVIIYLDRRTLKQSKTRKK